MALYAAQTDIIVRRDLPQCRACWSGGLADRITYKGTERVNPEGTRCVECGRELWSKVER